MGIRFLLPCECGRKLPVDINQAGLNLTCECSRELKVPSRRGLNALEIAEDDPGASKGKARRRWGPKQGLKFLGISLLLGCLIGGSYLRLVPPQDDVTDRLQSASLLELMNFWQGMRHPFSIKTAKTSYNTALQQRIKRRRVWSYVCWGGAGIGLLIALGSLAVGQPNRPAAPPPAPR